MPTGGWSATQISTTKLNSIASVRLTQPSLASQTQCTSNSIASAPPLADPSSSLSNGSQDDGAPLGGPPAILIAAVGSKRLKVRLRFAAEDAASYASTEAMPETAMVLRPKPAVKRSKIYGDGNPTRVGKGNWRARAEEIDFSSSATIEEAIPSYAGKKYGQLGFPLSLLVDVRGNVNPDEIWCYQQVTKWRKMSPKDQKKEFQFQRGLDHHCRKIEEGERKKTKTTKKRNANKRKKQAQQKSGAAEAAEAVPALTSRLLNATEHSRQSFNAELQTSPWPSVGSNRIKL